MQTKKPILLGCSGPVLSKEEKEFFASTRPFGFILFQRNCINPAQLKALTQSLRETVQDPDTPIFIDQEGGRVARLKPPLWPAFPAMRRLGVLYEQDPALGRMAVHLHALLIARMLRDVGIDGNCAPVLDLLVEGASSAIGDRAFSADPRLIAQASIVSVQTYLENGVFPVIKHLPGHGRVQVDPHEVLPFVDASLDQLRNEDFVPFQALADAPMGMNCHVVFRAIDAAQPVSLSRKAHQEILRGEIGFKGLIFSDDLAMGAISGALDQVGVRALAAGADIVLYCSGVMADMRVLCAGLPEMSDAALARWEAAKARRQDNQLMTSTDILSGRLNSLLSLNA